jgi:hypothetical protein
MRVVSIPLTNAAQLNNVSRSECPLHDPLNASRGECPLHDQLARIPFLIYREELRPKRSGQPEIIHDLSKEPGNVKCKFRTDQLSLYLIVQLGPQLMSWGGHISQDPFIMMAAHRHQHPCGHRIIINRLFSQVLHRVW